MLKKETYGGTMVWFHRMFLFLCMLTDFSIDCGLNKKIFFNRDYFEIGFIVTK